MKTETASEILGKSYHKTQRWTTDDILELCDVRSVLKKSEKHILDS